MPLSRYQIRNEYSLADLELYKSADKDDPEALLEGVAMAGLVGVLRQLGDLAEFAAEVFHNLHEEVMATAARGHSLKARVQQLEVEFPLIENAFLSRTNHSAFFYNAGVDWHPNMHIDQNNITSGDLPRFVRDSHEEARGPPRLFLLDKFDVAGAGACLKRFTDPSFYKVEAITNPDVQRDKKVRKGKRRGSRWRNGETPEVLPTPHAKLHQLLLEERIENSASDPTSRVKLKRRLNGFPFDLKTGKSYMEKILRNPPPDYRELHEVYNSSPLKLLGDDFMPEFEKDDFGSESPDVELTRRSPSMSPDLKDGIQHVPMREMDFESDESYHYKPEFGRGEIGSKSPDLQLRHRSPSLTTEMRESKDFPKGKNSLEVGNITSTLYDDPVEKQMIVDKESRSEGSTGFKSVDFASDVENYMDALATTPLREAHFSDSQSIGSSTLSDDGNSSSKKYKSNSSYSGSPRILAQKSYLDDELSDVIDSSNEGETKSISRPLKWRGRTRNAGGSKITGTRPYSSIAVEPTFPNTDISSGFMVHRDVDSSVGENGVSQLKVVGMLSTEGVPGAEPSNVNESESNMSVNYPTDSTSSATHLQTGYDSIFQVFDKTHLSNNGEDSHMMETSSCKAITSDETCFTEESTNEYMEEIVVDKNMLYMLQDVTPASYTLDGAPLNSEENLSSPKTQPLGELANHSPRMSEQPLKPSPQAMPENGLHEDLSNDESGSCEVLGDFYRASVHPSSYIEDIAEKEMSTPSLENMPQAGDGEDDFEGYPVVNQSDSQITIMPPVAEQTMELRFPELETSNRETDADSTDDNQVRIVSPPNSENFRIFGMTYMLDPVDSSTDNQIEEQFPDRSLSDAEDNSDGAGHNVTLSGGSNMALADGEIAVEVEEDTLSGVPDGSFSKDIQAPEVLDSVSQFDVETSDNGDENLHELPSLVVRVETGVTPAGENNLVKESLNVGPEVCASNETQASEPADDMLQLQATRIEISSEQLENLHELARLAEQKLEGVSSSTDVGERSTTNGESIAESINTSDTNVEGGRTQSNQNGVDTEVLFSVMYRESGTEEKGNMQKVASQSMDYYQTESRTLNNLSNSYPESNSSLHTDITASSTSEQSGSINTSDADVEGGRTQSNQSAVDTEVAVSVTYSESSAEEKGNIQKVASQLIDYDQTDSKILDKLSNSYPESESSLHTDITESSTSEQSRSHMNVIRAEKNTLHDYTMDALPMPMYCGAEDQKVNLPLHQLDEKETEVFRIRDESNMESNVRDPSVLEPSLSSSKWVDSDKTVLTNYTQDISPMSTRRDEEEQKVKLPLHQLEEEINQLSTIAGESNVVLEPQPTQRINLDHLLGQERISGIASISVCRNLPGQQSDSELLPQEKLAIDDVSQHNKPLGSIFPAFGLLSEPVNTDQLDMPPLPPLPPVQWRMGKNQQASLAHEKAVLLNNNILFPSISLDSNSHLLSLGELQSLNNLAAVTESHAPNQDLLLPGNNSKFSSVSETQSLYQDLPLPAKLDEMPQHDEHTCTSLSASSQTNGDADADASACDVELVAGSSTLVQFNNPEATSQTKPFHQGSASSETNARTHDASGLLTKIENERPHNMMLSLEGEVAWPTQEDGKPYGVRPMKLPRQRNPLIDAVIALDKSKLRKVTELSRTQIQKADERDSVLESLQLRKVTEQPRTQMQKADERDSLLENFQLRKVTEQPRIQIQKADERDSVLENLQLRKVTEQPRLQIQETDERDSLLEQIRAKSFNLKPPVVSKPAVQGPTTNLKLAAILEKAKTIRQAFAGSDEDDDDDSWSDS